jgi:hypothetical protein
LRTLDPQTLDETVSRIADRLLDVPSDQLFLSQAEYIISDLIHTSPHRTREFVQLLAAAARTEEDLKNLYEFEQRVHLTAGNKPHDTLLSLSLKTAEQALTYSNPAVRHTWGVSTKTYNDMVATAQAVVRMVNLVDAADRPKFLRREQRAIIEKLEQLLHEQKSEV